MPPPFRYPRDSGELLRSSPAILCQDNRLLIIDKPAGLPVHPGRAGGPSVEDFFPAWRHGKNGPWAAHRLDQDTAGCLVIALKKSALLAAQAAFAAGTVQKTYWALVRGVPDQASGVIDLSLAKQTAARQWKMVFAPDGQPAVTAWRLRGTGAGFSWLELHPRTGRTHQIRAHCAAIGHPVLGDAVYGGGAGRLMLLAREILLPLEPPVGATAPVPAHMRAGLLECGHAAV
jgi:tRNA pseudouridine32 synthase/23S rRNA pseudouridine746 synthase